VANVGSQTSSCGSVIDKAIFRWVHSEYMIYTVISYSTIFSALICYLGLIATTISPLMTGISNKASPTPPRQYTDKNVRRFKGFLGCWFIFAAMVCAFIILGVAHEKCQGIVYEM
jgi:hypothetical protein